MIAGSFKIDWTQDKGVTDQEQSWLDCLVRYDFISTLYDWRTKGRSGVNIKLSLKTVRSVFFHLQSLEHHQLPLLFDFYPVERSLGVWCDVTVIDETDVYPSKVISNLLREEGRFFSYFQRSCYGFCQSLIIYDQPNLRFCKSTHPCPPSKLSRMSGS